MAGHQLRCRWVNLDPSTTRGAVIDALAVYFADAILASALVARWWAAQRTEIVDGAYRVRDDELRPQIGAALHRTPELEVNLTKFCRWLRIVLRRHARSNSRSRKLSNTMPIFDHRASRLIEPEMTIRIVSLNIQQGGGKRTGPIADWIATVCRCPAGMAEQHLGAVH
jgi:hypothetical protein